MQIEPISTDGRTKLMMTLQKLTNSLSKRNVIFMLNTHSEYIGNITLTVTGKVGSAQKTVVIVYNQLTTEWEAYCDGYIFKMVSLTELTLMLKSKINKLSVLLKKV
jgi:hypothetical protein